MVHAIVFVVVIVVPTSIFSQSFILAPKNTTIYILKRQTHTTVSCAINGDMIVWRVNGNLYDQFRQQFESQGIRIVSQSLPNSRIYVESLHVELTPQNNLTRLECQAISSGRKSRFSRPAYLTILVVVSPAQLTTFTKEGAIFSTLIPGIQDIEWTLNGVRIDDIQENTISFRSSMRTINRVAEISLRNISLVGNYTIGCIVTLLDRTRMPITCVPATLHVGVKITPVRLTGFSRENSSFSIDTGILVILSIDWIINGMEDDVFPGAISRKIANNRTIATIHLIDLSAFKSIEIRCTVRLLFIFTPIHCVPAMLQVEVKVVPVELIRFLKESASFSVDIGMENIVSIQWTLNGRNYDTFPGLKSKTKLIGSYSEIKLTNLSVIESITIGCTIRSASRSSPASCIPAVLIVKAPPATTTAVPTTAVPTTAVPTTAVPTTAVPTTAVPTTAVPTTAVPTTAVPTTAELTTEESTTAESTTAESTTAELTSTTTSNGTLQTSPIKATTSATMEASSTLVSTESSSQATSTLTLPALKTPPSRSSSSKSASTPRFLQMVASLIVFLCIYAVLNDVVTVDS